MHTTILSRRGLLNGILACWCAASPLAVLASNTNQQLPMLLDHEHLGNDPLLSFHKSLVQIESITDNEYAVGQYLNGYLTKHNFTVEMQKIFAASRSEQKPRFNLFAYKGNKRDTRVLVSSHIDTVPPFYPYEVRGNEIWGRGTVDDKACVASQITAVEQLFASGDIVEGDVSLLFVVGEEVDGRGMRRANDLGLAWEAVIFGEPTELKLASGHKGMLGFNIKATGKAAHSGYPWLGESAISMLLPALVKLDSLQLPFSEKYGNTTVNIGRIDGGVASNVVAETASAGIAVRLANGTAETSKKIVLDAIKEVDDRLEVKFPSKGYGPVHIDADISGLSPNLLNPLLSMRNANVILFLSTNEAHCHNDQLVVFVIDRRGHSVSSSSRPLPALNALLCLAGLPGFELSECPFVSRSLRICFLSNNSFVQPSTA